MYRFAGVRQKTNVKVQFESTQCCEPICGPTTCGMSESESQDPISEASKGRITEKRPDRAPLRLAGNDSD